MRAWWLLIAFGCIGCGGIAEEPTPGEPVGEDTPLGSGDNTTDTDDGGLTPVPGGANVVARPAEVMFYGDLTASAGLDPRVITIHNDTLSAVLLTSATIIDDGTKDELYLGGAPYFTIANALAEAPLVANGEAQITVAFEPSIKQRFAVLVITTTHPGFPELRVPLAGKVFVD